MSKILEQSDRIFDFMRKKYKINFDVEDIDIVIDALQQIDNAAWAEGYSNALNDNEIY